MRVAVVAADYPDYEKYCPHFMGIQSGLRQLKVPFIFVSYRGADPTEVADKVIAFNPDLVVYIMLDIVKDGEFRRKIRKALPKAKIVIWYGDYRFEQPKINLSSTVDLMFVSNDAQKEFYGKTWSLQCFFLPLATNPIPEPVFNKKFAFDFVFIGSKNYESNFYDRAVIVNKLEREQGLVRIDSQKPELRKKVYQAMPAIYSSSKITLDISHYWDKRGYASVRFWEIPAFWGFPLTRRFPQCELFYPENTHRVYWDTVDELLEKKDYYSKHETERQEIIQRSWQHTKDHHTHRQRFVEMFKIVGMYGI